MKQLILIHGAIGGADQMEPLKTLLQEDFEVHILEFDGHGAKAQINAAFTTDSFISQLNELIDRIDEPVYIFGYSMGGFVALLAAQENQKIKSITTLGTKMKWSPEIAEQEIRHLNPEKIKEKVPKFAQALEVRHGQFWEEVLRRTADFMQLLGKEQPINESRMSNVKVPVKLCLASDDHMVSEEETAEVGNWLENSRLVRIPGSKHPIEQVDLTRLCSEIRSFILSVE